MLAVTCGVLAFRLRGRNFVVFAVSQSVSRVSKQNTDILNYFCWSDQLENLTKCNQQLVFSNDVVKEKREINVDTEALKQPHLRSSFPVH